jgi:hypothetical protein
VLDTANFAVEPPLVVFAEVDTGIVCIVVPLGNWTAIV